MKTIESLSFRSFNTNIKVPTQPKGETDYNFRMLFDEAKRDQFLKNPVRKIEKTLSRSTSQPVPLYIPKFDPEKFNLDKKIKEIRRVTKQKPLNSNKKDHITYSKVNKEIVNESTNLINAIYKQRANRLNDENPFISEFLSENKEILINNHLLIELREEEAQIKKKEAEMALLINKKQEVYQSEQSLFKKAIDNQRKLYDEIEEILFTLQRNNNELNDTEKSYKIAYKIMEEEVEKYLEAIDNKRVYAKFVHTVMRKDSNKFQRQLIPYDDNNGIHFHNKKINYGELAREAIEEYDFCLKTNYNTLDLLQTPDDLMQQFSLSEEKIVKELQTKRTITEEIDREERERKQCLDDLMRRVGNFQKEEEKLIRDFNRLTRQVAFKREEVNNKDFDLDCLMTELHTSIQGKEDLIVQSRRNKPQSIQEIADKSLNLVRDIELKINDLFSELTRYEYDSDIFYQVVNKIKQDNKKCKQIQIKNFYEKSQNEKRIKAEERFNRLVMQSRKTEAPFQRKKKVVSMEIDPEELQRLENEAFMNF